MSERAFILVGGPDCGKTNYIARLWESIRSTKGALVAPRPPQDIEFVEKALEFLLKGEFAPRSHRDVAESTHSFEVSVHKAGEASGPLSDIVVPDVTGELWKRALETYEIPRTWMDSLANASGALLFVRVGSEENQEPLDWVTCAKFLGMRAKARAAREAQEAAGAESTPAVTAHVIETPADDAGPVAEAGEKEGQVLIPTQIALCEFLRFLEFGLKRPQSGRRPRVAVLVAAWDRLDPQARSQGPMAYLRGQFPMFAGRLDDIETLDVKAFGVSVVSGDFEDEEFKAAFFDKGLSEAGYVVTDDKPEEFVPDLTLPVSWVMEG